MVVLTEIEQGSSSSLPTDHEYQYDIFLSFRGADTRLSFTDHLYNALKDANFETFLDEEEIETGEELKPELESAIKASRAFIIVMSKNYASSTWCLEELLLILEQHIRSNKIVIPIFYHVEPTDVRKQQNSFGDAMAKHKQRMEEETNAEKRSQLGQKMAFWKKALSQVSDLKGIDVTNRKETEIIEEIISDIHCRLRVPLISNTLLIGMDRHIKFITSWLTDGSCLTADILTIIGMSGIGKTSLAKYVFDLHRHTVYKSGIFQKSSFLECISRRCAEKFNGLLDLTKQLYRDISKKIPLQVHDVSVSMIENVLARKKVFLVLDDIDSLDQLNLLLGRNGFHPGSKIIITTKHRSLTESYTLFNTQVQTKHTNVFLRGLYETYALDLLCTHAFKCKEPKEGYQEVSKELVRYCEGHPLALKVLGESLHNHDVGDWEACIEGLKKEPDSRVQEALHMSFNSLPSDTDKELFKDIACFFVGANRDVTETILEAWDRKTRLGIKILIDRCLLSISKNNKLMMHQLIQDLGRDLVRQESPQKPWKRSRLWCHEESFKVLKHKKGKGNIQGLTFDTRMLDKEKLHGPFELKTDSLNQMYNLILLQLNYVQINGSYENFPEELRWLRMHGFTSKSIPSDLPTGNLVALDLSYSNIESIGMRYSNPPPLKRQKLHRSLKILDLSYCEHLQILGGFLALPVLERLIVTNCKSLLEVCESIGECVKLVFIDLSYCCKLRKLPRSMKNLKMVGTLLLDGCTSLESRIRNGDIDSLEILVPDPRIHSQTPSSAIKEAKPNALKLVGIYLPCSLVRLSLRNCNLSNESFPDDLSCLSMLKLLNLDGNLIVSMPDCVRSLPRLETLTMRRCYMLTSIEHPPRTLRNLLLVSKTRIQPSCLQKIIFDSEMSPLDCFKIILVNLPHSSLEIDGVVKVQPMATVEKKVFHSLGWTNLEFLKERRMVTSHYIFKEKEYQTQVYYEHGIFSIFYRGDEMPNWISIISAGPSISFIIPSSPKKLRGLNFCYCGSSNEMLDYQLPDIRIRNRTKCKTWRYRHFTSRYSIVRLDGPGKYVIYLSHWMFGMNEMESGDHVRITIRKIFDDDDPETVMCGVSVVYDDEKMEEEGDALGYYKSWNHIIGGDMSPFVTKTNGEYYLGRPFSYLRLLSGEKFKFKHGSHNEYKAPPFKAFSRPKKLV